MGSMLLSEDNHVEERGGRERGNSGLLVKLMVCLHGRRREWGIEVFPSQDIQVSPTERSSADICVTIGELEGQIVTSPPFLCVEIHSIFEPMANQLRRIAAYLDFGVRHVWHIDPHKRKAMMYTATDAVWPEDGVLRTENPDIALPLAELF